VNSGVTGAWVDPQPRAATGDARRPPAPTPWSPSSWVTTCTQPPPTPSAPRVWNDYPQWPGLALRSIPTARTCSWGSPLTLRQNPPTSCGATSTFGNFGHLLVLERALTHLVTKAKGRRRPPAGGGPLAYPAADAHRPSVLAQPGVNAALLRTCRRLHRSRMAADIRQDDGRNYRGPYPGAYRISIVAFQAGPPAPGAGRPHRAR